MRRRREHLRGGGRRGARCHRAEPARPTVSRAALCASELALPSRRPALPSPLGLAHRGNCGGAVSIADAHTYRNTGDPTFLRVRADCGSIASPPGSQRWRMLARGSGILALALALACAAGPDAHGDACAARPFAGGNAAGEVLRRARREPHPRARAALWLRGGSAGDVGAGQRGLPSPPHPPHPPHPPPPRGPRVPDSEWRPDLSQLPEGAEAIEHQVWPRLAPVRVGVCAMMAGLPWPLTMRAWDCIARRTCSCVRVCMRECMGVRVVHVRRCVRACCVRVCARVCVGVCMGVRVCGCKKNIRNSQPCARMRAPSPPFPSLDAEQHSGGADEDARRFITTILSC